MIKKSLLSSLAVLVLYLLFWPVQVDPVSWQPPQDLGYSDKFPPNQQLSQLHRIELKGMLVLKITPWMLTAIFIFLF